MRRRRRRRRRRKRMRKRMTICRYGRQNGGVLTQWKVSSRIILHTSG